MDNFTTTQTADKKTQIFFSLKLINNFISTIPVVVENNVLVEKKKKRKIILNISDDFFQSTLNRFFFFIDQFFALGFFSL